MSQVAVEETGVVALTKKQQRFDRQIRLWGKHGQIALEECHICSIGSGATATEIIKNLVLPSVGKVTILDDAKVTKADLGNNFFVRQDTVGQNRADVVSVNLAVLNPYDAKEGMGSQIIADTRNPASVVDTDLKFLAKFQLIVNTCLTESKSRALAAFCYSNGIHYLHCKANGLLGHIRLVTPEVTIIETKDDSDRSDVYVHPEQTALWPEYKEYLESFDFASMSDTDHRHTPFVAILHQQIAKYQSANGRVPKNFRERKAFKAQIREASRDYYMEENFSEAVGNAARACNKPALDRLVQAVLDDPHASNLGPNPTFFWICVNSLNTWRANEGKDRLPVSNNIPDMASSTANYIRLKDIFAAQAAADLKAISARIEATCAEHKVTYDQEVAARFIKNVRFLGVARTTPFENEYSAETFPAKVCNDHFNDDDEHEFDQKERPVDLHWYFAFRAGEAFREANGRYPGTDDDEIDADTAALTKLGSDLASSLGVSVPIDPRVFAEYVRYGNSEMHNLAAMLGGIASQIALKVCIHQFVPVNNTLIVNGIHMSIGTYAM